MPDEQHDHVNDESDTNRQQEQVKTPSGQIQKTDIPKSKKESAEFQGIAAHKWLKQKIMDIINGGK